MKIREDLPFYLNQKGLTGLGLELGVLRGEFSEHILRYWQGKKLYLVDAWRHISGNIDMNNPDHNGNLDNLAKTYMKAYGFFQRATIIRELSVEASELFKDGSLDFIYIDAAHDYENVRADLNVWYPKIKVGGIISGHDYIDSKKEVNGHSEFGVKKAVDEFAAQLELKVHSTEETDFPSWWIEL